MPDDPEVLVRIALMEPLCAMLSIMLMPGVLEVTLETLIKYYV
jgi:hypothetical protein